MKNCLIALMMLMTFSVEAGTVLNDIKVIKAYVIKMNKRVKALETKVAKLEKELKMGPSESSLPAISRNNVPAQRQRQIANNNTVEADIPDPVQPSNTPPANPQFGDEADKTALLKIKAPRRWSERAVKNYLNEIKKASDGQRSSSSRDYQNYLIKQIPIDYIETVLKFGLAERSMMKHYVGWSMHSRIRQQDKNLTIKYLNKYRYFIKAVAPRPSWHNAAWPTLVKALQEQESNVPDEWFTLVASKDKNDGNRALLTHLENVPSTNLMKAIQTTSLLKKDIKKSAFISWSRKQSAFEWRKKSAAICAVYYGNKDALKFLITYMNSNTTNDWYKSIVKKELIKVIDSGKMTITDWYEKYKRILVFDEDHMKFVARVKR